MSLNVDECSGNVYSTGITMLAKTTLGEWTPCEIQNKIPN